MKVPQISITETESESETVQISDFISKDTCAIEQIGGGSTFLQLSLDKHTLKTVTSSFTDDILLSRVVVSGSLLDSEAEDDEESVQSFVDIYSNGNVTFRPQNTVISIPSHSGKQWTAVSYNPLRGTIFLYNDTESAIYLGIEPDEESSDDDDDE